MQTEKEKFEKWYREYYGKALGWDFRGAETSGGWYYFDDDVENFWQAWKARAALDRAAPRQVADCGLCGSQILVGAFPAPPAAPNVPEGFIGTSEEADFSLDTWTFKMEPGYRVSAGRFLITRVPATSVVPSDATGDKQ